MWTLCVWGVPLFCPPQKSIPGVSLVRWTPRYCWNCTTQLHNGEGPGEPRANMLWLGQGMSLCHQTKGPEGGLVPCDSVTKVFREENVKEWSSWPSGLGLVGEAMPQEASSPARAPPSLSRVYVFACVFTHLCLCSGTPVGGVKGQLFKRPFCSCSKQNNYTSD